MAYMDINNKKENKTVVLLHGKNFSGFYWERIANDLVKRGYRVIIPDQIGFGKSTKPKSYQYSFGQLALNTMDLLKSLNVNKFSLVGHSMGGMLATTIADSNPMNVEQIISINPIGLEEYIKYVQFKDPSFFYKIEFNKTSDKIISYQKKNYYDGKWSDEYQKLVDPFIRQLNHKDWPLVAWNNALTYGPIFSENILPKIERYKMPSFFILGTRDRTGPGRNWKKDGVKHKLGQYQNFRKKLKKLNPKSTVYVLDRLGHLPQFEDYERFSSVFYKQFPSLQK